MNDYKQIRKRYLAVNADVKMSALPLGQKFPALTTILKCRVIRIFKYYNISSHFARSLECVAGLRGQLK